jgi:hypothetical protein
MIITGNPKQGVAQALYKLYPDAAYCSRTSGYDLTDSKDQQRFALVACEHDVVVINAALWKFQQTVLLDTVYKACRARRTAPCIVVVGSTTDRVNNGRAWLYNAEKKALRDYANTLAIGGVWTPGMPKVSYISFGTLTNNQHKHGDRTCLDIDQAAEYIKWLIDQPKHVNINEISIDPVQRTARL